MLEVFLLASTIVISAAIGAAVAAVIVLRRLPKTLAGWTEDELRAFARRVAEQRPRVRPTKQTAA